MPKGRVGGAPSDGVGNLEGGNVSVVEEVVEAPGVQAIGRSAIVDVVERTGAIFSDGQSWKDASRSRREAAKAESYLTSGTSLPPLPGWMPSLTHIPVVSRRSTTGYGLGTSGFNALSNPLQPILGRVGRVFSSPFETTEVFRGIIP